MVIIVFGASVNRHADIAGSLRSHRAEFFGHPEDA
jgi:hypothetical protein